VLVSTYYQNMCMRRPTTSSGSNSRRSTFFIYGGDPLRVSIRQRVDSNSLSHQVK